jgi:hypothetical protein
MLINVYLRKFQSVTLGKGVYQVADILAVILLLCEQFQQSTAEERHESLSFTLYHLRLNGWSGPVPPLSDMGQRLESDLPSCR